MLEFKELYPLIITKTVYTGQHTEESSNVRTIFIDDVPSHLEEWVICGWLVKELGFMDYANLTYNNGEWEYIATNPYNDRIVYSFVWAE